MNENHVIAALKGHLLRRGYKLVSECSTTMRGIDLVMKKRGKEIRVEAKGSTSSRENSRRFGKAFTDAQCHDHFSRAFFKACQMRDETFQQRDSVLIAMAFAYTKHYQKYCSRTERSRRELRIGVFWVRSRNRVKLAEQWSF